MLKFSSPLHLELLRRTHLLSQFPSNLQLELLRRKHFITALVAYPTQCLLLQAFKDFTLSCGSWKLAVVPQFVGFNPCKIPGTYRMCLGRAHFLSQETYSIEGILKPLLRRSQHKASPRNQVHLCGSSWDGRNQPCKPRI
jgi:hypothetical protein